MKFARALAFALLFCVNLAAQTAPPKESAEEKLQRELEQKAVALVRRTADDAAALKLPENRACVYASAGNLLWKSDEKTARDLFERAAAELKNYQSESDDEDNEAAIYYADQLRRGVLGLVARNDAELALRLLVETRLPSIAARLDDKNNSAEIPTKNEAQNYREQILARQIAAERDLEEYLIKRAIFGNPNQAAKLLRAAPNKSVALAVLPALEKLRVKDLNRASKLADEILNELAAAPIADGYAFDFLLQYFANEAAKKDKSLQINRDALAKIAAKIADSYLRKPAEADLYYSLARSIPTLERFVSAEIAQKLRAKVEVLRKRLPAEEENFARLDAYRRADATVEKTLADAAKLPAASRQILYSTAIQKLLDANDFTRARQIINEKIQSKERENLLEWVRQSETEILLKQDRLAAAREMLALFKNKNLRVNFAARVALAYDAKKTGESHQTALSVLDETSRSVDLTPESEDEMHALVALVAAYAEIEPERAFALLDAPIDKFDDLLRAGSIVRKFVKNRFEFRRGEFVTGAVDQNFRDFFAAQIGALNKLARFDFDRAANLANKFSRAEIQTVARMLIAESVLQPEPDEASSEFTITDANNSVIGFQAY